MAADPALIDALDLALRQFGKSLARARMRAGLAEYVALRSIADVREHLETVRAARRSAAGTPHESPLGLEGIIARSVCSIAYDTYAGSAICIALGGQGVVDDAHTEWLADGLEDVVSWNFVDGFEAFESFLRATFACCGHGIPGFWNAGDYGAIPITEIPALPKSWYIDKVRDNSARLDSTELLNRFRQRLPRIEEIERRGLFGTDLRSWKHALAVLRHVVVHSRGAIDEEKLLEIVARRSGVNLDSVDGAAIKDRLLRSTRSDGHLRRVCLVDRSRLLAGNSNAIDALDRELSALSTSGVIVYRAIFERLGATPLWERGE